MNKQTQNDPRSPSTRLVVISLLGLAAAGILGGWLLSPTAEQPSSPGRPTSTPSETVSPLHGENGTPPTLSDKAPDFDLREGTESAIPLATLSAGETLMLDLELTGDAGRDFGIKSAWIYQENREPLAIRAERSGPSRFRAELPSDSLAPGRAIIELRTDESSPLALRRFAVQIR